MTITFVKNKTPLMLTALILWTKGAGEGINLTLQHKQLPGCSYRVLGYDPSTGKAVLAGEGKFSTTRPLKLKLTKTDLSFFTPKWSN